MSPLLASIITTVYTVIGNFSFDSDQDILIWNDESNEYGDSTNFVRSQTPESELGEVEDNPTNLADGGYDPYYGDGYSDPFEQENDFNTTLSNTELIRLNDPISVQLSSEWKNAYNQSVSRDFRISNVHVRNVFPTIERHEQLAAVITEVEFWFVNQGGSSAGSVYTVVIIDASSGDILNHHTHSIHHSKSKYLGQNRKRSFQSSPFPPMNRILVPHFHLVKSP